MADQAATAVVEPLDATVAERRELRAANVADRPGVKMGDHAATNDAKTGGHGKALRGFGWNIA